MQFDFTSVLPDDTPQQSEPWGGFPEYNFVGGHNDSTSVPVSDLIAAAENVLTLHGTTLATYGLESGPQGFVPLREFIANNINERTAMKSTADNVLITSGSLQALDLVNKLLLRPGDTVIVEQDTYGGALTRLSSLKADVVGIPVNENGMQMDFLQDKLESLRCSGKKAKYIYTIPTVQNPSGTVMPEDHRIKLLALAKEHQIPVFEDDCYADLLWDGSRPRAIRAMDDSARVIYCGSFSKSIAPALRVGYLIADWPLLGNILSIKNDAGSGALEQMVLSEFCRNHFDSHVAALTKTLEAKCEEMIQALNTQFGTAAEFNKPKGGIFIWVKLPKEVDTTILAKVAALEGVAINPGSDWSTDKEGGRRCFRLCFGNPTIEKIHQGVARLAEICHREFGLPARSANISWQKS